jgi:hypothetical protein
MNNRRQFTQQGIAKMSSPILEERIDEREDAPE